MSKYATLEAQYKDRECLIAALAEMGYKTVEVQDEAVNLYGYHGDLRPEKANVIVRRQYIGCAANDIGFIKNADGTYSAIISEYDSGHYNQAWNTELTMWYNYEKSKDEVTAHGMTYTETQTEDGRMQLKCRFRQHQTENPEAITL